MEGHNLGSVLGLIHLSRIGLWAFALVMLLLLCVWLWLEFSAKKEVDDIPKVPMLECPKHGLYPESAVFTTTAAAVGRPDLQIQHCPFCYEERLGKAAEILEK